MTSEFSTEFSALPPAPPPHGGGEPGSLNIKRMLRLRLPLILGVFLILAVPSVTCVWFLVPAEYEASTDIRFAANQVRVFEDDRSQGPSRTYGSWVNTQASLIQSPTILQRVLDEPRIRNLQPVADAPTPLWYLQSVVSARIMSRTELVTVSCKTADPEVSKAILEVAVQKYMEYAYNEEANVGDVRRTLLVKERDELRNELDKQLLRIKSVKKEIGVPLVATPEFGPSETQSYRQSLSDAQSDLITQENQIKTINMAIERVKEHQERHKADPSQPIYAFGVESAVQAAPEVGVMQQQLAQIDNELAVMRDKYRDDAPQLRALEEKRASVQAQLTKAEHQARSDALNSKRAEFEEELAMTQRLVEDARQRLQEFEERIEEHTRILEQRAQGTADIEEMEAKANDWRAKLKRTEDEIYQIDVESKAPGQVSRTSQVIGSAEENIGKRLQLMAMAFLASLGAGVAAGLWRELADQKVRTQQDLGGLTTLPVLASIPHSSVDRHSRKAGMPLLTADDPGSNAADQFRRVLTRIIYPPEGSAELNTCLVVSPARGDGKTSLACNLATALAQAKRRVLLVDVNARRPQLEESFGLEPAEGLGEILFGECEPTEVVRETRFPNLSVIGPGFHGDRFIGKLASREAVEFLEQAEGAFEHVIIDTPPALLMSDAKLLAPVVDGVILVVGVEASTTGMVRRCLSDMEQIGANIVGVVLNGVRPARGGYLRQNLALYYEYSGGGDGHTIPAPPPQEEDLPEVELAEADGDEGPVVLLSEETTGEDEEFRG